MYCIWAALYEIFFLTVAASLHLIMNMIEWGFPSGTSEWYASMSARIFAPDIRYVERVWFWVMAHWVPSLFMMK